MLISCKLQLLQMLMLFFTQQEAEHRSASMHTLTISHSCGSCVSACEKQLFSTGPTGGLSARLLMMSIWRCHWFPVTLIKSRLIKTFAINPMLTLEVSSFCCCCFVFLFLHSFHFDNCLSVFRLISRQSCFCFFFNMKFSWTWVVAWG